MDKIWSSMVNSSYNTIGYSPSVGTGCCCFRVSSSGVTPARLEDIRGDPPSRRCLPPASCDQNEIFSRSHLSALRCRPPAWFSLINPGSLVQKESSVRLFGRADRVWPRLSSSESARARARTPLTSDSSRIVFSRGYRGGTIGRY